MCTAGIAMQGTRRPCADDENGSPMTWGHRVVNRHETRGASDPWVFRVALAATVVLTLSCGVRRTLDFTIAEGVSGWIEIEFGNPECAALQEKATTIHIPIPESGYLCTSSGFFAGVGMSNYFFNTRPERTVLSSRIGDPDRMVWDGCYIVTSERSVYRFFVGSEQDWRSESGSAAEEVTTE